MTRLEDFEPRGPSGEVLDTAGARWEGGVGGMQRRRYQVAGYSVHAVKGASEDEEVIAAELREAGMEFAVVD
jgi:hypothetical protein